MTDLSSIPLDELLRRVAGQYLSLHSAGELHAELAHRFAALEYDVQRLTKERDKAWLTNARNVYRAEAADAEVARLREMASRMAFIAEHLFGMVSDETWRASGGDDGQGNYEGDHHASVLYEEITAARAALAEGGER